MLHPKRCSKPFASVQGFSPTFFTGSDRNCSLRHIQTLTCEVVNDAIVNNASVGALTGNPGIASYIASKHGVVGLTRTAALEYVKHGIRVNAVNPGLIDTQIARDVVEGNERTYAEMEKNIPMGRAGRPEEIASAVLWLCSPGASYVVGHALTVDGGMTVS
jgi:NAD(P)-dependent dehydrogenase (short-subunit alcohol dehydrogenase family)